MTTFGSHDPGVGRGFHKASTIGHVGESDATGHERLMLAAVADDLIGAACEGHSLEPEDFDLFEAPRYFTDDTVLTVATAHAILTDGDYEVAY